MAVGTQKGSSNRARSRGRVSSNGSSGSSGSSRARAASTQSASRRTNSGSKKPSQSRSAASRRTTSRSRPTGSASSASSARNAPSNGRSQDHSTRETIANIGIPVVSATIGVAGGVLLGRTALQRNRKLLGIPLPVKVDMAGVTQQIGEAGKQFGKLASEVRSVREKAEQIGKAIT